MCNNSLEMMAPLPYSHNHKNLEKYPPKLQRCKEYNINYKQKDFSR